MEWIQVLSLFLANVALILWFRSESRSDWRHMDNKLDIHVNLIREEMKSFQEDMKNLQVAMLNESKDFHARLCVIEERNKK